MSESNSSFSYVYEEEEQVLAMEEPVHGGDGDDHGSYPSFRSGDGSSASGSYYEEEEEEEPSGGEADDRSYYSGSSSNSGRLSRSQGSYQSDAYTANSGRSFYEEGDSVAQDVVADKVKNNSTNALPPILTTQLNARALNSAGAYPRNEDYTKEQRPHHLVSAVEGGAAATKTSSVKGPNSSNIHKPVNENIPASTQVSDEIEEEVYSEEEYVEEVEDRSQSYAEEEAQSYQSYEEEEEGEEVVRDDEIAASSFYEEDEMEFSSPKFEFDAMQPHDQENFSSPAAKTTEQNHRRVITEEKEDTLNVSVHGGTRIGNETAVEVEHFEPSDKSELDHEVHSLSQRSESVYGNDDGVDDTLPGQRQQQEGLGYDDSGQSWEEELGETEDQETAPRDANAPESEHSAACIDEAERVVGIGESRQTDIDADDDGPVLGAGDLDEGPEPIYVDLKSDTKEPGLRVMSVSASISDSSSSTDVDEDPQQDESEDHNIEIGGAETEEGSNNGDAFGSVDDESRSLDSSNNEATPSISGQDSHEIENESESASADLAITQLESAGSNVESGAAVNAEDAEAKMAIQDRSGLETENEPSFGTKKDTVDRNDNLANAEDPYENPTEEVRGGEEIEYSTNNEADFSSEVDVEASVQEVLAGKGDGLSIEDNTDSNSGGEVETAEEVGGSNTSLDMLDEEEGSQAESMSADMNEEDDVEYALLEESRAGTARSDERNGNEEMETALLDEDAAESSLSEEEKDTHSEEDEGPPTKATPAFCFYLEKNRWQIEQILTRSSPTFNHLSNKDERNAVISEVAVDWWTKLSEDEQKPYIDMSLRDFEARVYQWFEENAARVTEGTTAQDSAAANDSWESENKGEDLEDSLDEFVHDLEDSGEVSNEKLTIKSDDLPDSQGTGSGSGSNDQAKPHHGSFRRQSSETIMLLEDSFGSSQESPEKKLEDSCCSWQESQKMIIDYPLGFQGTDSGSGSNDQAKTNAYLRRESCESDIVLLEDSFGNSTTCTQESQEKMTIDYPSDSQATGSGSGSNDQAKTDHYASRRESCESDIVLLEDSYYASSQESQDLGPVGGTFDNPNQRIEREMLSLTKDSLHLAAGQNIIGTGSDSVLGFFHNSSLERSPRSQPDSQKFQMVPQRATTAPDDSPHNHHDQYQGVEVGFRNDENLYFDDSSFDDPETSSSKHPSEGSNGSFNYVNRMYNADGSQNSKTGSSSSSEHLRDEYDYLPGAVADTPDPSSRAGGQGSKSYEDTNPNTGTVTPESSVSSSSYKANESDDDDDESIHIESGRFVQQPDIESGRNVQSSGSASRFPQKWKDVTATRKRKHRPKWVLPLVGGAVCLLFLLLIIILPVTLTRDGNNEEPHRPTGDSHAPDPPLSPPIGPPENSSATSPPTESLISWLLQDTLVGQTGSAFGASVTILGNVVVVGDPLRDMVKSYLNVPDRGWQESEEIFSEQLDSGFGTSISTANQRMVIGAPTTFAAGTEAPAGAAFFYVYNQILSKWQRLGGVLRGDEDILIAGGEEFGSSVAVSGAFRVVVGAPKNSLTAREAGRVYTFELSRKVIDAFPLVGESAGDLFGFSIAVSKEGLHFVGGAPGTSFGSDNDGRGYVRVHAWLGTSWQVIEVIRGEHEGEAFGSSVAMLSDSGDTFAVGAPGFDGSAGRIVVFKLQPSSGEYKQLGPDIVGQRGESLGMLGSLTGGASANGPIIIASTMNGDVLRFDYDAESDQWKQLYTMVSTQSMETGVVAFSVDEGAETETLLIGLPSTGEAYILEAGPTEAPTLAPTASPVATLPPVTIEPPTAPAPPSPTQATTAPIPPPPGGWSQLGGPFTAEVNTGFGSSVALTDIRMAAGAPDGAGPGVVSIFDQQQGGAWPTEPTYELSGTQNGGAFGAAIAMRGDEMLVGAPKVNAGGSITPAGKAFCYARNSDGTWSPLGADLAGATGLYASNEDFGASVAMSSNRRVAVGAPGNSEELVYQRGKVYVFDFDSTFSEWTPIEEISGTTVGEKLGSSVDLSSSGNFLVVGSPNGPGSAQIYQYNPVSWISITSINGEEENEALGTSVSMLSDDGTVVAVGAPGYQNGSGRILVYQREASTGRFARFGPAILGEDGDRIGEANQLSGSGFVVFAGTSTGFVKRYEYQASTGSWTQTAVDTGASANLLAIFSSPEGNSFVAGGEDKSTIWKLL